MTSVEWRWAGFAVESRILGREAVARLIENLAGVKLQIVPEISFMSAHQTLSTDLD
jgi:hypothetical protein